MHLIYKTSDHVVDIFPHLLIGPDRLSSSDIEFPRNPLHDHQIHVFAEFEYLNIQKTVNGHIDGIFF